MRLDGKICVVTGGASGLGEATVKQFCADGGLCAIFDLEKQKGEAERVIKVRTV